MLREINNWQINHRNVENHENHFNMFFCCRKCDESRKKERQIPTPFVKDISTVKWSWIPSKTMLARIHTFFDMEKKARTIYEWMRNGKQTALKYFIALSRNNSKLWHLSVAFTWNKGESVFNNNKMIVR